MNEQTKKELVSKATEMLDRAYVPYSKFPVGAALLTSDGDIYSGCNIENASFGLTNCAERTAIFKAVSEGNKSFDYLVVTGNTEGPISPCGACRQVLVEFCAPEMPVLLTNKKGKVLETTVSELLPGAFQSGDMV
ncbi:cytidine deaminase [Alkalibacterium olivapovliticus]|uniref:Cytidine deaminase n=1 Tax=Alkalibacterium olivapovliticus TaxID=99907 RepID=A0A2T0W9B8_9LACT|nr:cytidine deaminase [Alkalibacterium olivapovliticus]PRY83283.1 cytidine deaminase [Alkalibacterium olivapovliticus]